MTVRVKICGLTTVSDAMAAVEAGADALGLMFYARSSRYVDLSRAATIAHALPPFVAKVGVFANPCEEEVRRAVGECGLDTLQFHGSESPEFCARFWGSENRQRSDANRSHEPGGDAAGGASAVEHGRSQPLWFSAAARPWPPAGVIKAFRIRDLHSLEDLPRYPFGAWLLDSYVPGQTGGTGETFNWELAVQAGRLGRPIILAGGLKPENVAEAVRQVRPYAVDVSSGVERAPGQKDHERVRAFIRAAKSA